MTASLDLILVDLDNVLFGRSDPLRAEDGDAWLDSTRSVANPGDAKDCVVVFAMNLETAGSGLVSFEAIDAVAHRLSALAVGGRSIGTELVLTLPVKQSADKALERLLGDAPLAEHAGRLAGVHLVSGDHGLRDSIGDHLGTKKYVQKKRSYVATSWTLVAKKGRNRRGPSDRSLGFLVAAEHPSDPAAALDTPARVLWAEAQAVQVPAQESLQQLAGLLRRRIGLLTQVGPTVACIRGVARLGAVARGEVPALGPCSPSDGVELCGADLAVRAYSEPQDSSLGPGAVRFGQPSATARTLMPPRVARATTGTLRVHSGLAVKDGTALRTVSNAALLQGETFKVKFSQGRDGVAVQVTSGFGIPLPAWWLRGAKTRDKISRKLRGMTQGSLTVAAVSEVVAGGGAPTLRVRAPFSGQVVAELKEPLADGRVGVGRVEGIPVAILAWEAGQHGAGPVACRPVQELSDTELRRAYPSFQADFDELREIPIMVPV